MLRPWILLVVTSVTAHAADPSIDDWHAELGRLTERKEAARQAGDLALQSRLEAEMGPVLWNLKRARVREAAAGASQPVLRPLDELLAEAESRREGGAAPGSTLKDPKDLFKDPTPALEDPRTLFPHATPELKDPRALFPGRKPAPDFGAVSRLLSEGAASPSPGTDFTAVSRSLASPSPGTDFTAVSRSLASPSPGTDFTAVGKLLGASAAPYPPAVPGSLADEIDHAIAKLESDLAEQEKAFEACTPAEKEMVRPLYESSRRDALASIARAREARARLAPGE